MQAYAGCILLTAGATFAAVLVLYLPEDKEAGFVSLLDDYRDRRRGTKLEQELA